MELHALNSMLPMAQPHDLTLGGARTDLHRIWNRSGFDQQRMIAHRLERIVEPAKIVRPSWTTGEVLPCIRRDARTTLPPKASPIH